MAREECLLDLGGFVERTRRAATVEVERDVGIARIDNRATVPSSRTNGTERDSVMIVLQLLPFFSRDLHQVVDARPPGQRRGERPGHRVHRTDDATWRVLGQLGHPVQPGGAQLALHLLGGAPVPRAR